MITTIYTCDRCGVKQTMPDQMWQVGIVCYHINTTWSTKGGTHLWCRKCCDDLQIIYTPQPTAEDPQVVEITFEDKLREIIREEMAS